MRIGPALVLALLAGCPDRTVSALVPEQGTVSTQNIAVLRQRNVDLLFVIDNSGSMEQEQASLRANFGKFMDVLSSIEGGLPNMHIGVVTSNMGQSAEDGVGMASFGPACAGKGDDGVMRTAPAITGHYIVDEARPDGTRTRNYSGTLADAFSAVADVGTTGCGIEQHLASAARAFTNVINTGFLRDDAVLAIVFIQDEDDCSLEHTSLFSGTADGTVINFRCTGEGIVCDEDPNIPGMKTNCRPKDNSAYLARITEYAEYFKSLKTFPEDIMVAGIVGDPTPVAVTADEQKRPVLAPSCTHGGQFAYPAVRTTSFLSLFGNSVRSTICNDDLSSGLVEIGKLLRRTLNETCISEELLDISDEPGLQYSCVASDYLRNPDGTSTELGVVPQCGKGDIPCWRLEENPTNCTLTSHHLKLVVDRGGTAPDPNVTNEQFVRISCVTAPTDGPVQ